MARTRRRIALAAALVLIVTAGAITLVRTSSSGGKIHVTGYFANSNGVFVGDDVRILGVPVGKIDKIEPFADRVKIDFWYDDRYHVPADAIAAVISPSLVSVRAIQLTPAYQGGPQMVSGTVIPIGRTAVPMEFDDFRVQLQRLTEALQPTQPGGVSTLGGFVNTAADNLRGQGANIRDTIIKLSQAFSALGDHSNDLFTTVKNLSLLVSALQSSHDLLRGLNQNLAGTTALLSNTPNEVGNAISNIDSVVGNVQSFVAENRDTLGTTVDALADTTTILNESKGDLKQLMHIAAPALQNFVNIYQPSQGALTGAFSMNNFANPIQFICGAIQAASRLGAEQSSKLCVQYLAPIVKNRQINFLPLGENLFVGQQARPNEITYSEDRLRPDYIPPAPGADRSALPAEAGAGASPGGPLPPAGAPFMNYGEPADPNHGQPPFVQPRVPAPDGVEFQAPQVPTLAQTDPAKGFRGMMVPAGGSS